jgi:hypothetical protein
MSRHVALPPDDVKIRNPAACPICRDRGLVSASGQASDASKWMEVNTLKIAGGKIRDSARVHLAENLGTDSGFSRSF